VKIVSAVCLAALLSLSFGLSARAADKAPLSTLKPWINEVPFEPIGGHDLTEMPAFKERLKTLLGKEKYAIYKRDLWGGVSFPVKERNNVLLVHFCMPHACMNEMIFVFADMTNDKMDVCWTREEEPTDHWLSEGKNPRDIGTGGCFDANDFALYDKYYQK